jgi:hypothetical protein
LLFIRLTATISSNIHQFLISIYHFSFLLFFQLRYLEGQHLQQIGSI